MKRGEVYAHAKFPRHFVVLSADYLNAESGVGVVAEIRPEVPPGLRSLIAVRLGTDDPLPGVVRADRLNFVAADYLGDRVGQLSPVTMEQVGMALRAVLDLD